MDEGIIEAAAKVCGWITHRAQAHPWAAPTAADDASATAGAARLAERAAWLPLYRAACTCTLQAVAELTFDLEGSGPLARKADVVHLVLDVLVRVRVRARGAKKTRCRASRLCVGGWVGVVSPHDHERHLNLCCACFPVGTAAMMHTVHCGLLPAALLPCTAALLPRAAGVQGAGAALRDEEVYTMASWCLLNLQGHRLNTDGQPGALGSGAAPSGTSPAALYLTKTGAPNPAYDPGQPRHQRDSSGQPGILAGVELAAASRTFAYVIV